MKVDDGKLAGALEYWRTLQLTTLLQELDETSLEIIDNQKTSLQERRKLAERTKEFRMLDDSEKLADFKPLLRAYQNEIDSLTKRMKYAENGFLRVFKSLNDAPDPQPFLSNLIDERKLLEEQQNEKDNVKRLQAKVDELKTENAQLRGDTATVEQLRQEVEAFETSMAQMVRDRVAEQEKESRDQTDALITHLKEREGDLQRQLSAATRKLAQLQQSKDAEEEERLVQATPADREIVAKLAELEIVQADLDYANTRVTDLMAHNARLRQELSSVTGSSQVESVSETLAEYRRRVRELDDETQRLFGELEEAQAELELKDSKHRADVSGIETELQAKADEVQRLRDQIQRYADYDEIKRDLDIMKSVEFSVSDWGMDDAANSGVGAGAGDDAAAPADAAADDDDEGEKTLERLLVRRNKSLENRLIDSKNELTRCHGDLEQLKLKVGELETKLAAKSSLAERLEADLVSVQQPHSKGNPEKMPADESMNDKESNVLDIVTSQRDRFRHRNMELEDELRMQGLQANDMRRQVDQCKQDNLRLYEEVKYLRSYKSTNTILGSDTAVVGMPSKFSSQQQQQGRVDMDTGVAAKYKGMYEESLNPFNAFHRRETTRRIRSMNLLDRLMYIVANFVVGDRRARIGLVVYIGMLHLLVMVTLYRSTVQADDSMHDATNAI